VITFPFAACLASPQSRTNWTNLFLPWRLIQANTVLSGTSNTLEIALMLIPFEYILSTCSTFHLG
jgi:hypothetical protein